MLSNKEGSAIVTVSTEDEKFSDNITINVARNIENDVQAMANEDLTEVILENGITYEINNKSNEAFSINPIDDYYFKYDIISYDSSGSISYARINDNGGIYINSGEKVKIRLKDEGSLKISIPTKYKNLINTNNNEIFYKTTLLKEKGYEINTNSIESVYITKEYGYSYYKYIEYVKSANGKGDVAYIDINSYVYSSLEISPSRIYRIEMNEDTDYTI